MIKISARFSSMQNAHKTVEALKKMGFKNAYLDAADNFADEFSSELTYGGIEVSSMYTSQIIKSFKNLRMRNDSNVTSIHGQEPTSHSDASGVMNTRLVVKAEQDGLDKIAAIIEEWGGIIES